MLNPLLSNIVLGSLAHIALVFLVTDHRSYSKGHRNEGSSNEVPPLYTDR